MKTKEFLYDDKKFNFGLPFESKFSKKKNTQKLLQKSFFIKDFFPSRERSFTQRRFSVRKSLFKKFSEKKADGFTFVETLAVLAIGVVLSAGSIVSASRIISMAKKSSAKNQILQFSSALQTYFLDCGRFPTTEQGLEALWEKPVFYPIPENWNGPYLDRQPGKDPWGGDFVYLSSESSSLPSEVPQNLPFVLFSYGADGQIGGEGEGADIVSWK